MIRNKVKAGSDIDFNGHVIKFKVSGVGALFRAGVALIPGPGSACMRDRKEGQSFALARDDT